MEGWICLHRKILDNPIVCKDSDYFAVWVYLLLNATHKEIKMEFKGKKIILFPGQLITGRKSISKALKIDEYKIQRILKCLENEQQIAQQTSSRNRLITIKNWHEYQEMHNNMHNKCTTNAQQMHTNNNETNIFNIYKENKEKITSDFYSKMRFLRRISDNPTYLALSSEEKNSFRNMVLQGKDVC